MPNLHLRPMSEGEFQAYRERSIHEYANAHVKAGSWPTEEAEQRSAAEFAELLPDGLATEDMLLYTAERGMDDVVGLVWLSLKAPRGGRDFAWIYDIEVVADRRGQGYGVPLLGRRVPVGGQDLLDHPEVAPELGLDASAGLPVAGRLWVGKDLLKGPVARGRTGP